MPTDCDDYVGRVNDGHRKAGSGDANDRHLDSTLGCDGGATSGPDHAYGCGHGARRAGVDDGSRW